MLNIVFSLPDQTNNEIKYIHKILRDDNIDYFHLRKPKYDAKQLKDLIEKIDADLHFKIVIHSHYHLINEFDLAGISLNKKVFNQLEFSDEVNKCFIQPLVVKNRQVEVNRVQPYIVSYSAHSIDEIINLPFNTSYVFLSPIFDSISKPSYNSNFDLDKLKEELHFAKAKVIALGGVKVEHFYQLKLIGFSGYARLGSYWSNID